MISVHLASNREPIVIGMTRDGADSIPPITHRIRRGRNFTAWLMLALVGYPYCLIRNLALQYRL